MWRRVASSLLFWGLAAFAGGCVDLSKPQALAGDGTGDRADAAAAAAADGPATPSDTAQELGTPSPDTSRGEPVADANLAPVPVGHWALDETTGTTAADSSAAHNNGKLDGIGGLSWVPGIIGNALSFDGVDDIVRIPYAKPYFPTLADSLTVSAWVKLGSRAAISPIATTDDGSGGYWLLDVSPGFHPEMNVYSGSCNGHAASKAEARADAVLSQNAWHHLAGVLDRASKTVSVYLDGERAAMANAPTTLDLTCLTNGLTLGAEDASPNDHYLQGQIDDVRLYDRALSAAEILGLFRRE